MQLLSPESRFLRGTNTEQVPHTSIECAFDPQRGVKPTLSANMSETPGPWEFSVEGDRSALTRAAQTGLSCSPSSLEHVLRPLPRQDSRRLLLRTSAPRTWPSPRHARLGSCIVPLSRRQASLDVAARALAPSVEAFDAPLRPRRSLPAPGACYRTARFLSGRDLHPLVR